jgi:hypothetical protein
VVLAIVMMVTELLVGPGQVTSTYPAVRGTDEGIRDMVAQGVASSPMFALLVTQIREARVIVYVDWSESLPSRLEGALLNQITSTPDGSRIVRVVLKRQPPARRLIPVLAHELQHVIEAVKGAHSLEQTFDTLGPRSNGVYETEAAISIQRRVEQELRRR